MMKRILICALIIAALLSAAMAEELPAPLASWTLTDARVDLIAVEAIQQKDGSTVAAVIIDFYNLGTEMASFYPRSARCFQEGGQLDALSYYDGNALITTYNKYVLPDGHIILTYYFKMLYTSPDLVIDIYDASITTAGHSAGLVPYTLPNM